jgi:hypothetical protein
MFVICLLSGRPVVLKASSKSIRLAEVNTVAKIEAVDARNLSHDT